MITQEEVLDKVKTIDSVLDVLLLYGTIVYEHNRLYRHGRYVKDGVIVIGKHIHTPINVWNSQLNFDEISTSVDCVADTFGNVYLRYDSKVGSARNYTITNILIQTDQKIEVKHAALPKTVDEFYTILINLINSWQSDNIRYQIKANDNNEKTYICQFGTDDGDIKLFEIDDERLLKDINSKTDIVLECEFSEYMIEWLYEYEIARFSFW